MNRIIENNQVTISGEIASGFNFSHEIYGEKFYIVDVNVQRISSTCDIVPITVSNRLVDVSNDCIGKIVSVTGQFRSYNKQDGEKKRLVLSVFAQEFNILGDDEECNNDNSISLDGYICRIPVYRTTPLGREICDVLVAVNRPYGKSDYIPCVCWGRNARYASTIPVGSHISLVGRIQSRNYQKRISDEVSEDRTAYEVSVGKIEVIEDAD